MDLKDYAKPGKYGDKDIKKFKDCHKLISRGAPGSSSDAYSKHPLANVENFKPGEVVGISANGQRNGRMTPDFEQIRRAAQARVIFITDKRKDRIRHFNRGEREVATFLMSLGYYEFKDGWWVRYL